MTDSDSKVGFRTSKSVPSISMFSTLRLVTVRPVPTASLNVTELSDDKPVWELDGTLNIYLDHYLYVETALNLREEGSKTLEVMGKETELNDGSKLTTPFLYAYLMKQNRRVRSDEIHYFDHPRMGMILQIRKMQQPLEKIEHEATEGLNAQSSSQ